MFNKTQIVVCAVLALLTTAGVVKCINTPEPPPDPLEVCPKMCHVGEHITFNPASHRVRMTEETAAYRKYRVDFGEGIPWYYVTCDHNDRVTAIWSN